MNDKMPNGWTILAQKGNTVIEVHPYSGDTVEDVVNDLLKNISEVEREGLAN